VPFRAFGFVTGVATVAGGAWTFGFEGIIFCGILADDRIIWIGIFVQFNTFDSFDVDAIHGHGELV
jgi:hypothetical protein